MKLARLFLCFVLVVPAFAQNGNIVSEAKTNLETKHHKSMVSKAEKLLEEQKELESKLAGVKAKLAKLENGEDVRLDEESSGLISTSNTWPTTTCCLNTLTGCAPCR